MPKPGGRHRRLAVTLAGALAAVAIAAVSVWFFALRDASAPASYKTAPDFVEKPELGPKINAESLFDGRHDTYVFHLANESGDRVAVTAEPSQYLVEPSTTGISLMVVNAQDGKPVWKQPADLDAAAGLEEPYVQELEHTDSGDLVVRLTNADEDNPDSVLVAIGADGSVLGKTACDEYWTVLGEHVVLAAEDGDISVRAVRDIDAQIWSAEALEAIHVGMVDGWIAPLKDTDGTRYVQTADGYRELTKGREMGWGEAEDNVRHASTTQGVSLRAEQDSDDGEWLITRIDPANGEVLWEKPVESPVFELLDSHVDDILLRMDSGGALASIDTASGTENWLFEPAEGSSSVAIAMPDGRTTVLSTISGWDASATVTSIGAEGAELFTFDLDLSAVTGIALGQRVFYVAEEGKLTGYDMDSVGDQLWTLKLAEDEYLWWTGNHIMIGTSTYQRPLVRG
ncbi:MAG: PQQ-like beta-propeller repeat protein [Bifidobacteriaceae bacterium]|nr:PQQ-like beta-propeller repeat protein [Bifidobacteriaceae bacterium]